MCPVDFGRDDRRRDDTRAPIREERASGRAASREREERFGKSENRDEFGRDRD